MVSSYNIYANILDIYFYRSASVWLYWLYPIDRGVVGLVPSCTPPRAPGDWHWFLNLDVKKSRFSPGLTLSEALMGGGGDP